MITEKKEFRTIYKSDKQDSQAVVKGNFILLHHCGSSMLIRKDSIGEIMALLMAANGQIKMEEPCDSE